MSKRLLPNTVVQRFLLIGLHQRQAIALCGLAGFLSCLLVGLFTGLPPALVHDEFAYLLAADTFASGRLTNPTPPAWEHLDSFHIILHPTYNGKYPPAQGLVMALGQAVLGHPIVGVWLSVAAMCAAMCWMLQVWIGQRWAFFTAALVVVQFGFASTWAQSYWGGAVAATGGALLYGGLRRVIAKPRWLDGLWVGIGVAILANSRPYEGLLVSLPAAIILLWQLVGMGKQAVSQMWSRVALPSAAVLLAVFCWMGYFNYSVTGSVTTMPYMVHEQQYAAAPPFNWMALRETMPTYTHPRIEQQQKLFLKRRNALNSDFGHFIELSIRKLTRATKTLAGPMVLALLCLPWVAVDRWRVFALVTCALIISISLTTIALWPHYLAPTVALLYVLIGGGLRRAYAMHAVGRWAVLVIAAATVVVAAKRVYWQNQIHDLPYVVARNKTIDRLTEQPEQDLVFVKYHPNYSLGREFVFNLSDPATAEIVWAHDLGDERNGEAIAAYPNRKLWRLTLPPGSQAKLDPYVPAAVNPKTDSTQ